MTTNAWTGFAPRAGRLPSGQEVDGIPVRFAVEQDECASRATSEIQSAIEVGDGDRLMQLFKEGSLPWKTTSVLGCRAAEGLTKLKRYSEAIVIVQELESLFSRAIRPKQLHALALARRGAAGDLEKAQRMLATLKATGHKDPETLGIYARTWMDLYEISGNTVNLKKSRNLYAAAFEFAQDDYYTGINAASNSVLIGTAEDIAKGKALAKRVRRIVGTATKEGDYWQTATVAEVLKGFKIHPPTGKLVWFETNGGRFEALKAYLEDQPSVGLTTRQPQAAIETEIWSEPLLLDVRLQGTALAAAVLPPSATAVASIRRTSISLNKLAKFSLGGGESEKMTPDSKTLRKRGAELAKILFGPGAGRVLDRCRNSKLVVVHDIAASKLPFEILATQRPDVRPAVESGITRRKRVAGGRKTSPDSSRPRENRSPAADGLRELLRSGPRPRRG